MALRSRTRLIAITAAMVVLALVGIGVVRASDPSSLPPIEADRLLASTAMTLSKPITISGDVQTRLDLGLPDVPAGLGGQGGSLAMLSGTQRFRVWHSIDGLRLAHITQVSERDLVVNHDEAWWWDAAEMRATRVRFSDLRDILAPMTAGAITASEGNDQRARALAQGAAAMAAMAADPITAARRAIEAVAPYASVSVEGADEVAGRAVYDLVLTPLSDRTLIGSIEMSIDAETSVPLRFEVFARATGEAAMSAGFTSVSYDPIEPDVFEFTPPAGAEVIDGLEGFGRLDHVRPRGGMEARSDGSKPRTFGEGFETRVALPLRQGVPPEFAQLLPYAGPLLSAMVVEGADGSWLLMGSVPLDVLQADAAALR